MFGVDYGSSSPTGIAEFISFTPKRSEGPAGVIAQIQGRRVRVNLTLADIANLLEHVDPGPGMDDHAMLRLGQARDILRELFEKHQARRTST